jgi:hypothetical protein
MQRNCNSGYIWNSAAWSGGLWDCVAVTVMKEGPEATVRVNYRPILSSERVPDVKKPAIVNTEKKIGHEFQMGARHQDRLVIWPSVVA